MNYIKHLNQWMELVAVDDRLSPNHISIYLALFQLWNKDRFPDKLSVCRNEVLGISKIGSSKTYYKCLHELNNFGYIQYRPSYNPLKGSTIVINDLGDADLSDGAASDDDIEPEKASFSTGKLLFSDATTQVRPKKNGIGCCGKNDTGPSYVVTPLNTNNINMLNSKQREGRAREKKIKDDCIFQKQQPTAHEKKKAPLKLDMASFSNSISAENAEHINKREVPRNFAVPPLDDVKLFFADMKCTWLSGMDRRTMELEGIKFFHHYEANGWLVGKAPMRNWKAACRSWAAKITYFTRKPNKSMERKNFHVDQQKDYAQPL